MIIGFGDWVVVPTAHENMKKLNTHALYKLATVIHALLGLKSDDGQTVYDVWQPVLFATRELEMHLTVATILPASSRRAAQSLLDALITVADFSGPPFIDGLMSNVVEPWKITGVHTATINFEAVLASDLPGLDTYLVSKKGIYSTSDLAENAENALFASLPEDTHHLITLSEASDFQQAGRCLAFELPTASGFHAMRATEAIVRRYWRMVMDAPADQVAPALAECIKNLREKHEDAKVLDILDHARDLTRNPLMHPDIFLEMDDAYRTFDIAKSAICTVATRLKQLSPQLELAPTPPPDALLKPTDS